ncbi:MAG: hypothetical protein EPN48_02850 [Microbacteriaceae bacterium]|nr:MAG: hypothetical protein EPN48_02850 [Microbacteriaceae bacterium]
MRFELTAKQGASSQTWALRAGDDRFEMTDGGGATSIATSVNETRATIVTTSDGNWVHDLQLSALVHLDALSRSAIASWPLYQGVFEQRRTPSPASYEFRGPGWNSTNRDDRRLGIPAVIVQDGDGFLVVGTDPGYSAHLSIDSVAGTALIVWTYRREAGAHDGLARQVFLARADSIEAALDTWFKTATPDVPAGPEWLHEIGWQHYDYMSKNGDGWFADIDAVCEIVEPVDRHRVAFTLHAWYDTCGRYCYDANTGRMDQEWTVFAHIGDPQLLARQGLREPGTQPDGYTFRNLENYRPIQMSWPDVRHRIRYAKDRGFRVPFYLITGMMDIGSASEHALAGDGLDLEQVPLWIGPDAIGGSYLANPLHPDVRERFLGLTRGVLAEVGDLIDALVIDEAYYIGYGQLGPASAPGYADRAQATLIREIAELCHMHRPDIALLTADHVGTQYLQEQSYPYSLFADGIYHDAWNHSQAYEAARFPAWRNTVWSCSWAPVSAVRNTKWAVLAYDAPISTSNGCFGDDIGPAEYGDADLEDLRAMWRTKISRIRRIRPIFAEVL